MSYKLLTIGLVAQLVRALPCHGKGRGFKSHPDRKNGGGVFAAICQLRHAYEFTGNNIK